MQVEHDAKTLFGDELSCLCLYGGTKYSKQFQALQKGVHVVIGTPGRVLDHLIRRTLDLSKLKMLIFDEADRMLSVGFYHDMLEIKRFIPQKISSLRFFQPPILPM